MAKPLHAKCVEKRQSEDACRSWSPQAYDTSRVMRTAETLADEERLYAVLHSRHPELSGAVYRQHIFKVA